MRKLTPLAVALAAVLGSGVPAHGQSAALSLEGKISPKRAGTEQKPINAKIDARMAIDPAAQATLDSVEFRLPKTVKISGRGYPTCTLERITEPGGGESRCPKRSKVGSGSGRGRFQTVPLSLSFNVYVAAPDRAVLVLSSNGTTAAAEGRIRGSTLKFDLPAAARAPLPGMYTTVESLEAVIGGGAVTVQQGKQKADSRKRKRARKRTAGFVTTTGCTGGAHRLGVRLGVSSGGQPRPALSGAVALPCSKARGKAP